MIRAAIIILIQSILFAFYGHASTSNIDSLPENLSVTGNGYFKSGDSTYPEQQTVVYPGKIANYTDSFTRLVLMEEGTDNKGTLLMNHIRNNQVYTTALMESDDSGAGRISLRYDNNTDNARMDNYGFFGDADAGQVSVYDSTDNLAAELMVWNEQYGALQVRGETNTVGLQLAGAQPNYGWLGLSNPFGPDLIQLYAEGSGSGEVRLRAANGNDAVRFDSDGDGSGRIRVYDANDNLNVIMSTFGNPNRGFIGIFDASEIEQASMYIDGSGNGVIAADMKSFHTDFPGRENEEIWYVSLEGPEVAMFDMGTAQLTDGEAFVPYREDFALMADFNSVTVQLSPRSTDSYGLAVVEKSEKGFLVKELKGGNGNFSFDWEVKAKRKGFDYFEVVRNKSERKDFRDPADDKDVLSEKTRKMRDAMQGPAYSED